MPIPRRGVLAALIAAPALPRPALAQGWPARPVRLVIPFAPGGAADTLARTLAPHFARFSGGQPLVVDNRPGAGGTLAAAHVAGAAPDGYALLIADIGANAVAGALFRALPYDVARSFAPVVHLVNLPMALIARTDAPFRDTAGMIAWAKAHPGRLAYSSAGPGGASHLAMEMLARMAGFTATHIPYRGGSQVAAAVVQKEVDVSITTVSSSLGFVRGGVAQALAVSTARPTPLMPGTPPVAAAVPGYDAGTWHGVLAPAGTPGEAILAANATFNAILGVAEVAERLRGAQGAEIVGGTPEAFGAFVAAEIAKWGPVVRDAGITPE